MSVGLERWRWNDDEMDVDEVTDPYDEEEYQKLRQKSQKSLLREKLVQLQKISLLVGNYKFFYKMLQNSY